MPNLDKITLDLNGYEAALIFAIRKIPHGKVMVHMFDSLPKRIVVEESRLIDPKLGIELAFKKEKDNNDSNGQ